MKKKKIIITALLAAASVALAVIGCLALPDDVIVQVGTDGGASKIVSKFAAVSLPLSISIIGEVLFLFETKDREAKSLIIVIVGFAVAVVEMVMNGVL